MPAYKAISAYLDAIPDNPSIFTIASSASPWHLYDSKMRILSVKELASVIRKKIEASHKEVELIASWTGASPDSKTPSLASQLSQELDGFPVRGADGFLWINSDGSHYTTKQAFTIWVSPYKVAEGKPIMLSLVTGSIISSAPQFVETKSADALLQVGAAYEILMLCQETALEYFELAASLSQTVAAYNAAVIRLERNGPGDHQKAVELLKGAANLQDEPSRVLLNSIKHPKGPNL